MVGKSKQKNESNKKTEPVITDNITINIDNIVSDVKKRGRKPKGGKLITKDVVENVADITPANVILHLKCSLKDIDYYESLNHIKNPLDYDSSVPPSIMTYDCIEQNPKFARFLNDGQPIIDDHNAYYDTNDSNVNMNTGDSMCNICKSDLNNIKGPIVENRNTEIDNINIKDVNDKLKRLKVNLYRDTMDEKQSACFWCTYEFDNPACYIPKQSNDGKIQGYGSFCRPECAVGYLMKEQLDDSTKFERYHLLNRTYGKAHNYKKNIKPAPDPHYILDKFYGSLSIQEYRKLLNSERMLLVIDNPLTRILPELHEDTDDFVVDVYGGNKGSATQAGGVYKVKRQSEKQPSVSKSSIIKEKFGLTA